MTFGHAAAVRLRLSRSVAVPPPHPVPIRLRDALTILDRAVLAATESRHHFVSFPNDINCTAQVGFAGKGSATAELSASGQTTVKGALVLIN